MPVTAVTVPIDFAAFEIAHEATKTRREIISSFTIAGTTNFRSAPFSKSFQAAMNPGATGALTSGL